jgi:putative ABC transport system permease protein
MSFPFLFRALILRDLTVNPVRTFLTMAGVALGIAVVVAVQLANERAISSFNESVSLLNGTADIQIAANGQPLDENLIGRLGWLWDVGAMTAVIEGQAVHLEPGDGPLAETTPPFNRESLRLFGVDLLSDAPFRTYQPESSNQEQGASQGLGVDATREQFLDLLVDPRAIIVPATLADEWNVDVGDRVDLLLANRAAEFTVHSVLRDEGAARAFGGRIVFMDIAAAQLALGRFGVVDRIEVVLDDPDAVETVMERIRVDVSPPVIAYRPEDTEDDTARMTRAFRYNLTALSYIALIVGMILVYNTMNIAVVRRHGEVGTMRTLGVSRKTIGALFLAESVFFGVIGGAAGVIAGEMLARISGALVSRTIALIYTGLPGDGTGTAADPFLYFQMVLLGAGLAAVSGAGPAIRAARVSPVELMRGPVGTSHPVAAWTAAGFLTLLPATLLSFAPPVSGFPFPGYAAGVLFILAFALLSPLMARTLVDNIAPVLRAAFPAEGRLAVETIRSRLPRVMVAVVSLAIAVAMLSSVAIMVASFRDTVVVWLDQTLRGDLYLRPAASGADGGRNTLAPEVIERLEELEGIAAIDRFRGVEIDYDGFPAIMASGEFDVLARYSGLRWVDTPDSEAEGVVRRVTDEGQVVVSEPFSVRHGVTRGDSVVLPAPGGPRTFVVAAVFYDYSTEGGLVVMDRSVWIDSFGDDAVSNVAVYLESGADAEAVRTAIAKEIGNMEARIATNGELRAQVFRVFDQTFEVTYALEAISLAVAVLGVATTLAALTLERRAELSMLRFIGASRRQIRAVIVMESGLIGLLGTLIGLMLGGILSMLLVYVINFQSFGWTIQFAVPGAFLLQAAVVVMTATLAAGFYPATLALRTSPIEGIRAE